LFAATRVWLLQAAALAGTLWLIWHWFRGYKNGDFSRAGDAFEGLAVLVVCLAIDTPLYALGLVYNGLVFRSLYGNRRDVVIVALTYIGAFLGAVVLSLLVTGLSIPVAEFLPHVLNLMVLSAVFHVLATTLAKHERATTHERILREAGAALVAALDRESIYKATLNAALDLTIENPNVRVGLAMGSQETMTVVASGGYCAAEIRGDPLNICALPEPLHTRLLQRQPIEVEQVEDGYLREALGLDSNARLFFMTPLFIQEELKGAIGVTSESSLSTESKDRLVALSFQVELALESAAFAEDRHWRQSEIRFRSLIQNSSDIIMILGRDGAINYVSPSVQRMLGYVPEDLIGESQLPFCTRTTLQGCDDSMPKQYPLLAPNLHSRHA
jgi:PAS domain-containing protein